MELIDLEALVTWFVSEPQTFSPWSSEVMRHATSEQNLSCLRQRLTTRGAPTWAMSHPRHSHAHGSQDPGAFRLDGEDGVPDEVLMDFDPRKLRRCQE